MSAANHANDNRGRAIRSRLADVARACAAAGRPLPRCAALAVELGISASQVSRHLNKLMDQGAYTPIMKHSRMYVGEPQP